MNTPHRGFIVPLLLLIIAALLIGGYVYIHTQPGMSSTVATTTTQTNVATPSSNSDTEDVSNPNMAGGLCPNGQTYVGQAGKGDCVSTSLVAGMSKYTDTDFGFSFWYPTGWRVIDTVVQNPNTYPGGSIKRGLALVNPDSDKTQSHVVIEEYYSPQLTITDSSNCGPASNCPVSIRYYFDTKINHTWTVEKTFYPDYAPNKTTTGLPDFTINTMGGLHMFPGNARFGADTIIPLAADKFLIVWTGEPGGESQTPLARTIVATDPAVAVQTDIETEIATIQAEVAAYSGN